DQITIQRLTKWTWRSPCFLFFTFSTRLIRSFLQISCYTRLNHDCKQKTQLTYAPINCVLTGSSCDSPLPKILKFTILASNESSSSTKVLKCPHIKNDSIFTHYSQQFRDPESYPTLTLTKMKTCMTSPIGLPLFSNKHLFQLTQDQKGLFKVCNGADCK
ncbi:hypothetical protein H5410_040882, partial [Solanum commersonii]